MNTLQQIKQKSKDLIKSIDKYYFALSMSTDVPKQYLEDIAEKATDLTKLINQKANATPLINQS